MKYVTKNQSTENQAWLISHVEKLVLGGAGILLVVFLYMGYRQQGLTADPAALQRELEATRLHIERETWEAERLIRYPAREKFNTKLDPIDETAYRNEAIWNPPLKGSRQRRTDPVLLAPIYPEARAGSGPVAYWKPAESARPIKHLSSKERQRERLIRMGFQFDKNGKLIKPGPPKQGEKQAEKQVEQLDLSSRVIPGHRPPREAESRGARFVAVMALVPNLRQREEYEAAFAGAIGYDKARDVPKYLWYDLLRAESDDPSAPVDWDAATTKRFTAGKLQAAAARWTSVVEDPLPDEYFEPLLTGNAISLMMRKGEPFWIHSSIEPAKTAPPSDEKADREKVEDVGKEPDEPDFPAVRGPARIPKGQAGQRHPIPGVRNPAEKPSEFYLLRCYDTSVEPGKTYRYRVRIWFVDPNDPPPSSAPLGPNQEPIPEKWLDDTVVHRLRREGEEEAKAKGSGAKYKSRQWRRSPWSEPTEPVTLPPEIHVLAGKVGRPKDLDRQRHFELWGRICATKFDLAAAGDVAAAFAVSRSSQLNFQATGKLVSPTTLEVRELDDYEFVTKRVVVDLRGGEPLPAWRRPSDAVAPGEVLLLDDRGGLVVRSEVDDFDDTSFHENPPQPRKKPLEKIEGK